MTKVERSTKPTTKTSTPSDLGGRLIEPALSVSRTSPAALTYFEIEARTEGDDRRAIARAYMKEVAPDIFELIPFYLREISGARVPWSDPLHNEPINTGQPIVGFDQATAALKWWATRTFAENASLHR